MPGPDVEKNLAGNCVSASLTWAGPTCRGSSVRLGNKRQKNKLVLCLVLESVPIPPTGFNRNGGERDK